MRRAESYCGYIGDEPSCWSEDCSPTDDCYTSFLSGCTDDPTAVTTQAAATTPSPNSVYCQEKCLAIYGWTQPEMASNCLIGCGYFESINDITTPREQICDDGYAFSSGCASDDQMCSEAFLMGCNDNQAFIQITENVPGLLSDCENNRPNVYADGSPVFGRDECLVFEHSVALDTECNNDCNSESACYDSCPVNTCLNTCETGCRDHYTDGVFISYCQTGCMISCFEMKGSDHICSGMADCGYSGTDPVCIAEGNCDAEAVDTHNDCYSAFQIGCKFLGINVNAQNAGASPQDDSNTGNVAPVDCPSSCHIKCIALQVRFPKLKPQAA